MSFNIKNTTLLGACFVVVVGAIGQAGEPQNESDQLLYTSEDKDFINKFNNNNIQKQRATWLDRELKTNHNITVPGPICDAFLKFKALQKEGDELYRWVAPKGILAVPHALSGYHYSASSGGPVERKISSQYSKPGSHLNHPPSPGVTPLDSRQKLFGWCLIRGNQVIAVIITNLYETSS